MWSGMAWREVTEGPWDHVGGGHSAEGSRSGGPDIGVPGRPGAYLCMRSGTTGAGDLKFVGLCGGGELPVGGTSRGRDGHREMSPFRSFLVWDLLTWE